MHRCMQRTDFRRRCGRSKWRIRARRSAVARFRTSDVPSRRQKCLRRANIFVLGRRLTVDHCFIQLQFHESANCPPSEIYWSDEWFVTGCASYFDRRLKVIRKLLSTNRSLQFRAQFLSAGNGIPRPNIIGIRELGLGNLASRERMEDVNPQYWGFFFFSFSLKTVSTIKLREAEERG